MPASAGTDEAILDAGVYSAAAAISLTGTMTLDGQNDPNAVFIFQVNAALSTAASSTIHLINGAQASNVFWQVNGAATTGASSSFSGTIMAIGAITLGAGASLDGGALSDGLVTLADNTISAPDSGEFHLAAHSDQCLDQHHDRFGPCDWST